MIAVLCGNEIKKCLNAKTTFIIFLIIIIGSALFAFQIKSQPEQITDTESNIFLQSEIDGINEKLSDPSIGMSNEMRTKYVNTLKIYKYMLLNNIEPQKTHSISNYMLSLNNLFAVVVILSIIVVAKIITDEYKYATLNILVAVPSKRYKILLSKIITAVIICIGIILVQYITSIVIGGLFFGFNNLFSQIVKCDNGLIQVRIVLIQSLLNNFYNIFTLITCSSITFMLSVVLKNGIISACAGICTYFFGSQIAIALKDYSIVKYSLFANMQFQLQADGVELFKGMTPGFSIIVLSVHSLIFILISFVIFNRRNIYE